MPGRGGADSLPNFDAEGRCAVFFLHQPYDHQRFERILRTEHITPAYYHHEPLRGAFRHLCRLPLLREMLVKMVVCVIEK